MTNGTPQNAPGPEWYPDPSTPGQLRFWDGAAWTAHVKPASTAAPVMPAPAFAAQPDSRPAQAAATALQPAPKKLANRAAGIGMFGALLLGLGVLLAVFAGGTAITVALVVGGAIVFVVSLVFCIVFTVLRR
jgi:predicted lipid-binding transport protein (Tim44 family)